MKDGIFFHTMDRRDDGQLFKAIIVIMRVTSSQPEPLVHDYTWYR